MTPSDKIILEYELDNVVSLLTSRGFTITTNDKKIILFTINYLLKHNLTKYDEDDDIIIE